MNTLQRIFYPFVVEFFTVFIFMGGRARFAEGVNLSIRRLICGPRMRRMSVPASFVGAAMKNVSAPVSNPTDILLRLELRLTSKSVEFILRVSFISSISRSSKGIL